MSLLSHSRVNTAVLLSVATLLVVHASAGCSSDDGGGTTTASDAAVSADTGAMADDASSSSSDTGTPVDAATAADTAPASDGATGADAGIGFLQQCMVVGSPGDCAAGYQCKLFKGKQKNFCTKPCTTATAATDCPAPSKGCGGDNFCSPP